MKKFLVGLFLSLSINATPAELIQEVLVESAVTPQAKKAVEVFYARLEEKKQNEIARLKKGQHISYGGKMIYSRLRVQQIQNEIEKLEK